MLYVVHGTAILTPEELAQQTTPEALHDFYADALRGKAGKRKIQFSTGDLTAETALLAFDAGGKAAQPWTPLGLGQPLCLMIREIYTGKYPSGGLFSGGKGMLVASAVKSLAAFDAKPRALNFLVNKLDKFRRITRPPATSQGTPYLFYSPALLDRSLTLDLELVFDTFPKEAFDGVGDLFTQAGSVPIFQIYSVYLLGAGLLTKLLGQAGEAIFDGKPNLRATVGIDICLPGSTPISAGFLLITGDNLDDIDPKFRIKKKVSASGQVLNEDDTLYDGDVPYVLVSIDGSATPELKDFAPTAATAAVLSRFYGIKDGQQQSLSTLVDAIKLLNDFRFRRELDTLDKQITEVRTKNPADPILTDLAAKRKAILDNIIEDLFKPKP